uniref:Uncharacterized protein n=1 Tax=Periophthalmus magnuspinnatus TaxID=409849 RepID=A0A3B4A8Y0_9GOBI
HEYANMLSRLTPWCSFRPPFSPSDPMICYILDGVLIIYCIVATALFFREKVNYMNKYFSPYPNNQDPSGGIYQVRNYSVNITNITQAFTIHNPFVGAWGVKKYRSL